jgi:hypothetical protein
MLNEREQTVWDRKQFPRSISESGMNRKQRRALKKHGEKNDSNTVINLKQSVRRRPGKAGVL